MADTITHTSGDYTLTLSGEATTVTARTYHLTRVTRTEDSLAHLTVAPGQWLVDAGQLPAHDTPSNTLVTLVQHVHALHGQLRVADSNTNPLLARLARPADSGPEAAVRYGSAADQAADAHRHRIR